LNLSKGDGNNEPAIFQATDAWTVLQEKKLSVLAGFASMSIPEEASQASTSRV
jgi:hypothetical protein